jgi:hypothetical protein
VQPVDGKLACRSPRMCVRVRACGTLCARTPGVPPIRRGRAVQLPRPRGMMLCPDAARVCMCVLVSLSLHARVPVVQKSGDA